MIGRMGERTTRDEPGVVTQIRPKKKLARPRPYTVLLHNDDYTTMEFVVWILETIFRHDLASATRIMLHVHRNGIGVAGVYPREVAETRAGQVEKLAREHEFPLKCTTEPE
jgi:ATP-dependent Clp protease adaptor protein ClpS